MSKKLEPPLHFEIQRSSCLLFFIIGLHGLSVLSCLQIALIWQLKIVWLLLVILSLSWQLRKYWQGYYQVYLQCKADNSWQYSMIQQDFVDISILPSSVLSAWLIILHIKVDKKYHTLLIINDSLSAEAYRQLKVALKVRRQEI